MMLTFCSFKQNTGIEPCNHMVRKKDGLKGRALSITDLHIVLLNFCRVESSAFLLKSSRE